MTLPEIHLTRDQYREIHRGQRAASDLVPLVLAHLFNLCPRCAEEFEAWSEELDAAAEQDYSGLFERLSDSADGRAHRLHHQRRQAAEQLRSLLALPPSERRRQVEEPPSGVFAPALADLLVDEAYARVASDPHEALALAQLAKTTLTHCSDASTLVVETYARASAHVANALRVNTQLALAADAFRDARFVLRLAGGTDVLLFAEINFLEASLLWAQRHLPDASQLLTRALATYRKVGKADLANPVLLKLGMVYREQGDLTEALRVTREALEGLDPEEEPRLYVSAVHNLAHLLQENGQYAEAQALVLESLDLYQRFPEPWLQLRLAWLQGNIARGLGRERDAEDGYRAVRDGFVRQGLGFDAALVSLDLALLYAEQGRARELKQLAAEMFGVFDAQDVHREAVAALMLFQEAVELEQIGSSFIVELIRYLEAARQNPALRFREPS